MKMTLAQRLYAAFGLASALLLPALVLVWQGSSTAQQRLAEAHLTDDATAAIAEAQSALWAMRWGVAQYVAVSDPQARSRITGDSDKLRAEVLVALQRAEPVMRSDEERKAVGAVRESFQRYAESRSRWLKLMNDGQTDDATKERAQTTTPAGAATVKAMTELIEHHRNAAAASAEAAKAELRRNAWVTFVFMALAVAGSGVIVVFTIRAVTGPIDHAAQLVRTVAAGDLTVRIDATRHDEVGRLLAAVKSMTENLAGMVRQVRQGSESIATASAEIATGNADLSHRTEQQAANLQQTASSMEEISATVKNNADSAHQAATLAGQASAVAAKGGEVVGQVVATMNEISSSSRRIGDIIGVIDGIAFQTNILALNAAVEAARAGEQGRGFAVVAGEVRSLAQRSAEAAREIKSLIGASVEKVDEGARLVNEAGTTMTEILTQVGRVNDLIGEISSATTQQTSGIDQVSHAVSDLDKTTQQNAALVEQAAAAAASLRQQAGTLVSAVSAFKL